MSTLSPQPLWEEPPSALPPPVCGVDEVGRGPLAGPVVAAAVVIPTAAIAALAPICRDSKMMRPEARLAAAALIRRHCRFAVALASVAEIEALNILHASLLAMARAVTALGPCTRAAIIDGNRLPPALPVPGLAVVGGDGRVLAVAAASILAKVTRDAMMADLARAHPGYGWETNAGYATAAHGLALRTLGPTPQHRRSFAPVRAILEGEPGAGAWDGDHGPGDLRDRGNTAHAE